MSLFKNKVIWITGASSGIGEALTYALHERKANLVISSRRREALEKVKTNCDGNTSNIHIIPLDLTNTNNMSQIAEEALSVFGPIDYLFNNGGISQRSLALDTQLEVTRKVMEVNFFGQVALTKAVLPSMINRQGGHVIVISSVMGKFGTSLRSSYAASKHALHGYFDCLRQEVYEHSIKVTLVCPGYVKTDITLKALEGDGSRHDKMGKGQEKGMQAGVFAEKLLSEIAKGKKEEIYIGGKEILGVYLKRYVPRLFNQILRKSEVT